MGLQASSCLALLASVALLGARAAADVPYFNGFETPSSVNDFTGVSGAGTNIQRVASGGGTLGYTPAGGNFYAEITNTDNFVRPGYGDAGITNFGTVGTGPSTGFAESVSIYIDTARWLPTGVPGSDFVISAPPVILHDTGPDFNNIIFSVSTAGTVNVSSVVASNLVLNATPQALASITTSGWYQLVFTAVPGTTYVENDVSILDAQGHTLGTLHGISTVPAADLMGNGTMTFGPWENGFANDVLAIDNLQTYAVPEPLMLGALGLALPLIYRRR